MQMDRFVIYNSWIVKIANLTCKSPNPTLFYREWDLILLIKVKDNSGQKIKLAGIFRVIFKAISLSWMFQSL